MHKQKTKVMVYTNVIGFNRKKGMIKLGREGSLTYNVPQTVSNSVCTQNNSTVSILLQKKAKTYMCIFSER
jgi:hypothetical protein